MLYYVSFFFQHMLPHFFPPHLLSEVWSQHLSLTVYSPHLLRQNITEKTLKIYQILEVTEVLKNFF